MCCYICMGSALAPSVAENKSFRQYYLLSSLRGREKSLRNVPCFFFFFLAC